ncbi:hypothetical protein B5P43_37010 [Bacillus sp. SRB_336]|nr:hypothetical protein B5P43_37010 [Bacillus sp. SRB_336]
MEMRFAESPGTSDTGEMLIVPMQDWILEVPLAVERSMALFATLMVRGLYAGKICSSVEGSEHM